MGEGKYKVEIFKDGVSADKNAQDYKHETIDIPANKKLKIIMGPVVDLPPAYISNNRIYRH